MSAGELTPTQTEDLKRAVRRAEDDSELRFSLYLGESEGEPREHAERLHAELADPAHSVLVFCDPEQRALEIVTGAVARRSLQDAETALARIPAVGGEPALAVCLFDPDWHAGVVGLVASKMKERLHRPVIAFAPAEPGSDQLRGSARSIPGLHIRDVLAAVDCAHPGLVERFGGHAMAAGMSLRREALAAFERAFAEAVGRMLDPVLLQAELLSDGELLPGEFDRFHAEAIRDGGPWGQGFAEPLFDGVFEVLDWKPVGDRHLKLRLRAEGVRSPLAAIQFGGLPGEAPAARQRLAYRLSPDDWRGGDAIQLIVEHRAPA